MTDFSFSTADSTLSVGVEVEYPSVLGSVENRGGRTEELQNEVAMPPRYDAHSTWDGTVGLEIVSSILDLDDAADWYRDVIEFVEREHGVLYNPVGILEGGSTAGTHIHISDLNREKARELFEISMEPWAQVLFCSSIVTEDDGGVSWPVFRGGSYCRTNFDQGRYSTVNNRGGGHYEWRMPEPAKPEHFEIITRFLALFKYDTSTAIEYAQELLDDGDERITSIWRAEMVGMDVHDVPSVRREQASVDPENFYEEVSESWELPEIYTVEYDGTHYYVFDTRLSGTFNVDGITFSPDDVLYADSLDAVTDVDLASDVYRSYQSNTADTRRETNATNELKKIVKKKK